ncbi:class I adenylate-forming enzyme family protein [uncultured Jatrophihabitans sp.]|uniref:class I adenylate-forming enzyme family protein n=1 Tax=uncultured Jatrophihabitans sp. TaxID=1610747 RepID=UPI0035CA915E
MLWEIDSFAVLIDARAELTPDATMLVDDCGDTVTFAGYRSQARARARELADLGIGSVSTVCWQLPNTVDAMVRFGALALLGAQQAPMPIAYRRREIGELLRLARPDLVVSAGLQGGRDHDVIVAEAIADVDKAIAQHRAGPLATEDVPDLAWAGTAESVSTAVRFLYATSGSTGTPKLAMHTDASILAWVRAQSSAQRIGARDVVAYSVSLAHIAGAYMVGQALACGNTALLLNGFDPERTTAEMDRHGATVVVGVPTVFSALVQSWRESGRGAGLARLRFCASGAAPKPPDLHSDVRAAMGGRGLVTSYGMSEAGAIAVATPDDTDEQLENTVGRPVGGMSLRIVGADGTALGAGEVGEIRVQGPGVFVGYSDPALNGDVLDDDGYFRTGDLGVLRSDGHLAIVGRLKDVIIRKGENIVPQEIEKVLFRMPEVRDAVVVGVADARVGERVCAVVSLGPGLKLTLEQVAAACLADGLMMQKLPETLYVIDEIPRTPTGKADKVRLRADLAAGSSRSLPV